MAAYLVPNVTAGTMVPRAYYCHTFALHFRFAHRDTLIRHGTFAHGLYKHKSTDRLYPQGWILALPTLLPVHYISSRSGANAAYHPRLGRFALGLTVFDLFLEAASIYSLNPNPPTGRVLREMSNVKSSSALAQLEKQCTQLAGAVIARGWSPADEFDLKLFGKACVAADVIKVYAMRKQTGQVPYQQGLAYLRSTHTHTQAHTHTSTYQIFTAIFGCYHMLRSRPV
jgi:hypothetical protein